MPIKAADRIILTTPVLSPDKFQRLMAVDKQGYDSQVIELSFDPAQKNLQQAVAEIAAQAEAAVRAGTVLLVLSDRNLQPSRLPVHSLLATVLFTIV